MQRTLTHLTTQVQQQEGRPHPRVHLVSNSTVPQPVRTTVTVAMPMVDPWLFIGAR